MIKLREPVIILDCQTTGMHPNSGRILEIGWTIFTPDLEFSEIESWIVKGDEVPGKIRAITGIGDEDLEKAEDSAIVFEKWRQKTSASPQIKAVAHYAQFEKAFLKHWHEQHSTEFALDFVCSHRIAKKLFPEIPSQNLRGLAGFFGGQLGELKRCSSHIDATRVVWKAIVEKLCEQGIEDFESLQEWMKEKPKKKVAAPRYEYRMDRLARLALPDKPGIYRMLSKDGRILYVGKATSLKSRVNSYFRGQKGRDRRKLELMAQVWDLKVTECETPLEAALLETDEIKKWDPPYNVSLKTGDRRLLFYSRDFEEASETQDTKHSLGPYRPMNNIESVRQLQQWRSTGVVYNIFYQEIDEETLNAGFNLFCEKKGWDPNACAQWSMRRWLTRAALLLRELRKENPDQDPEDVFRVQKEALKDGDHPLGLEEELTPEQMAGKFERLLIRCAMTVQRSHRMNRLRNANVRIPMKKGERRLVIRDGKIGLESTAPPVRSATPWAGADIADYDRMSILLSEIIKHSCTVE